VSLAHDLLISSDGLSIRRMRDLPQDWEQMRKWRSLPHVLEWWWSDDQPAPPTLEELVEEYAPDVRGETPTTDCFIEVDVRPIGFTQFYPWAGYPTEMPEIGVLLPERFWGIDTFIGDPQLLSRGYGSRAVALLIRYLLEQRGAAGVALVVARENHRAQRAYQKAGLHRVREVLDIDRRHGERIPSYLMSTDPKIS
jgi:aminoglycoside 6'-N-acetyltransferase